MAANFYCWQFYISCINIKQPDDWEMIIWCPFLSYSLFIFHDHRHHHQHYHDYSPHHHHPRHHHCECVSEKVSKLYHHIISFALKGFSYLKSIYFVITFLHWLRHSFLAFYNSTGTACFGLSVSLADWIVGWLCNSQLHLLYWLINKQHELFCLLKKKWNQN